MTSLAMISHEGAAGRRLTDFLVAFLGDWPETGGLTVVGAQQRTRPGWDGSVLDVIGVTSPTGGVLSVRPEVADAVRAAVHGREDIAGRLPAALGRPGARPFAGTFRWSTAPTATADVGDWVPVADPRLPDWLRPFGGEALVSFIDGRYAAGVGIKRHNSAGLEISVGTEEEHRGKGLATRLVAQAARRILAAGAIPIYLHDPANLASASTALRAGFPDRGWEIIGLSGG
jgi:GNAT superfamily N-acetyltransferase